MKNPASSQLEDPRRGLFQDLGPRLIYAKAILFFVVAALASTLLLLQLPTLRAAALLGLALWSTARLYYFCFYVIEKYIDPTFRFTGLTSVAGRLISRSARRGTS